MTEMGAEVDQIIQKAAEIKQINPKEPTIQAVKEWPKEWETQIETRTDTRITIYEKN